MIIGADASRSKNLKSLGTDVTEKNCIIFNKVSPPGDDNFISRAVYFWMEKANTVGKERDKIYCELILWNNCREKYTIL